MSSLRCFGISTGVLLLLLSGGIARAGVDQWDFTGNLSATAGSGTLNVDPGGVLTYTTDVINGQTADVASFVKGTILRMAHGFGPNGGGSYVNQYTLIMDVMFPDTVTAGYVSLYQTNTGNSNDGDWFVKSGAGVGISGTYGGSVADGEWHRLALVVDLVAGTLTSYVNGVQAMRLTLAEEEDLTLDGRWSLDPEVLLLADNDGETAAGFINSLQFRDEALSAAVIAAYGGPTGFGLPPPLVYDFEQPDGPPEGWVIPGPTVAVTGGQLVLGPSAGGAELGTIVGVGGQPLWLDRIVRIEAKIAFPGVTTAWPFDHGGIFFCAQTPAGRYGASACYVIDYLPRDGATAEAPGRFRLAKFVGGAEQPLTQTAQTITKYEGTWAIELTDTEIVFTVDGVQQIRFANADLRGGYMGFWAYQVPAQNRMTVDDLKVTYAQAPCPGFLSSKVALTAGKAPESALVRIPTRANLLAPYVFTIASAQPEVAAPVGHTGGALEVTVGVGDPGIVTIPIEPGIPGETKLGLSVQGADCSGVTVPVEVLGLFAFEEHFTQPDGPPAGWYIASQSAQVIGEVLSLKRGTADPFVWYAVQGVPVKVGKMESVSCWIKFARTSGFPSPDPVGCHGGMVLAPTVTAARGQGYMIDVIERASDNGFRIYKDNNAGVQLGGPRAPYVWDAEFHEWKVTFTPTGFTFSVDGVQKADVQDLTYRGGYLSFWCYTGQLTGQNMFVDDISIEFGSSYCATIAPAAASNRPPNPKTVFTVNAPYGSNFNEDYSLIVTSTKPEVAVPVGATDGVLVLTYPKGASLAQTFQAECLSPGTTEFVVTTEGAVCPNSFATFTVPEPGLPVFCEQFEQPDGPPEGWTAYLGNWQVVGEQLTISCAPGGTSRGETWIWAGSPPVKFEGAATYEFSIDLAQETPDGVGRHGGIMFFASAPTIRWENSGYELDWIDRAEDHGYRFLRVDNGVHTVIGGPTLAQFAEPGLMWRIEIDGENLRFLADGELVFDVVDPTYREGHFGFWTYCNTTVAAYDNLGIGVDCMPPVASFTATPQTGCAPLEVAFDAATSTDNVGVVSYDWDFGDLATGTEAVTTHTYAAPGAYTVVLTVADAAGYIGTMQKVITVNDCEDPVASFTATPETGPAPLEVSFDATASTDNLGIVSYEWDFGDLANLPGPIPTHTYTAPGTYTVVLTVADAAGNTGTAEKVIIVTTPGGRQKPMDISQDGFFDISDAIGILSYLFLGVGSLPCGDQTISDPANLALINANGDTKLDLSDPITILMYLFLGGPRPVMCTDDACQECIVILNCPDNARCP